MRERNSKLATWKLLLVTGLALIVLSLLYNELLLSLLDSDPPLEADTLARIRLSEAGFFLGGLVLVLVAEVIRRLSDHFRVRPDFGANVVLIVLSASVPLYCLELALRPFASLSVAKTTVFVRDAELGWRMRPGTVGILDGVPVRINNKGLRGPEVAYEKPPNVTRVLFLGDSVTAGFALRKDEDAYPYVATRRLAEAAGREIQTINAAVNGYSTWQQAIYLWKEGFKYNPDLVVVAFNPNDVTDKYELKRFGGYWDGWTLEYAWTSVFDRLRDRSALFFFGNQAVLRLKFGKDIQAGAQRKEFLSVGSLVHSPDSPEVLEAWSSTYEELDQIFDFCKSRGIAAAVLICPYRFQLEDPIRYSAPQRAILKYSESRSIPALDLIPPLIEAAKRQVIRPEYYFLDQVHLTEEGNRVVGEIVAEFLKPKLVSLENARAGQAYRVVFRTIPVTACRT